ncbi:CDP-alcohol phosphatidyltransferase family protein [bacterium]|nr:CDP-alcohol phosphatidyltransferase family protein [bacterium]
MPEKLQQTCSNQPVAESQVTRKIFTVSNILTLSRILMLPLTVFFLVRIPTLGRWPAIIVGTVMVITDILDGMLARKLNQISYYGMLADPIVDKIIILTFAITLIVLKIMSPWFILLIGTRYLLMLLVSSRALLKYGVVTRSNFIGRLSPLSWSIAFIVSVAEWRSGIQVLSIIKYVFLSIATVLTVVTTIAFVLKYKNLTIKPVNT